MTRDLFLKPMTLKEQLLLWMLDRPWTKTHEVIDWGRDPRHLTTRADRYARDLASDGWFRRMTESEKADIAYYGKEDVWIPTTKEK